MVKRRKKASVEVNWLDYFESIQQVCPWSLPSFKKNKIKISEWQDTPEELEDYDAVIYVYWAKPRLLKKRCRDLNMLGKNEWLWSHPQYGHHSAPVPCLIQQNLEQLRKIRDAIRTKQSND